MDFWIFCVFAVTEKKEEKKKYKAEASLRKGGTLVRAGQSQKPKAAASWLLGVRDFGEILRSFAVHHKKKGFPALAKNTEF